MENYWLSGLSRGEGMGSSTHVEGSALSSSRDGHTW